MKDQNRKIFKNAQVTLEGNLIRCDNNSIQISNVSQIWAGGLPKVRIPMNLVLVLLSMVFIGFYFINSTFIVIAALGSVFFLVCKYWIQVEYNGLNLELCSGEIYSFVSKNTVFVNRVYHLINEIIVKNEDTSIYNISFKGNGEIIINPEMLTAEELTSEELTAEELTAEELKAEKLTAEELTAEELTAKKLTAEELTAEKLMAEELTAEELTSEKLMAEELTAEELTSEELTAEKLTAKKLKAKKLKAKNTADDNSDISNMPNLDKITEQLFVEINELYIDYRNRDNIDTDILVLIGQTTKQIKTGDKKSLKESYGKFITFGLINNCNELGLNILIEEIRKNVLT